MKSLITGQSQHLHPYKHASGATITCEDGVYTVGCCQQVAPTLEGLGQKPCVAAKAATAGSTRGDL